MNTEIQLHRQCNTSVEGGGIRDAKLLSGEAMVEFSADGTHLDCSQNKTVGKKCIAHTH